MAAHRAATLDESQAWQDLAKLRDEKHDDIAHQILRFGLETDGTVASAW